MSENIQLNSVKQNSESTEEQNGISNHQCHESKSLNGHSVTITDSEAPEKEVQITYNLSDDNNVPTNGCSKKIYIIQTAISTAYQKHKQHIKWTVTGLLAALFAVYFGFAMSYSFGDEASYRLLWMTCLILFMILVHVIKTRCGNTIYLTVIEPSIKTINKMRYIKWVFLGLFVTALVVFIGVDIAPRSPYNLVSLGGVAFFILILYIFSENPSRVVWRPVIWGLGIQFVFALCIIRTKTGYIAFLWLGERINEFLQHVKAGSSFVFGEKYTEHMFAFWVMPIVVFISTIISVLHYLGLLQLLVQKLGWLMQITLGTTPGESLNAAANIFLAQTESVLLVRPLLKDMTASELFAVLTGGYASIAGGVMATYIAFGVPPNHLLTASVMTAPAALAISKLFYPETEHANKKEVIMEKPGYRNIIEAASAGATTSVKLVATIMANLIAFLSLLAFFNATLQWLGERVGMVPPQSPPLTFQLICSYLFWPIPFFMGITVQDCRKVAELIGMKVFINEFVAYRALADIVNNTNTFYQYEGTSPFCINGDQIFLPDLNRTLVGGILQERSQAISTYALCGFANLGAIGVAVGLLGAIAPTKKSILSQIAVRALVAANAANFMSACIAGILFENQDVYPSNVTLPC